MWLMAAWFVAFFVASFGFRSPVLCGVIITLFAFFVVF
jgi:hypothetical protein